MPLNSITKNGLILAGFALVTTGLIALTFDGTKAKIDEQRAKKKLATLNEVIPPALYNNQLYLDCTMVKDPALGKEPKAVYRARMDGQDVALAIEFTAPDGYSGDIHLIAGVRTNGEVLGVRALEHKETPGLGDKIEMNVSNWMLSFNGKSYDEDKAKQWQVKKDGGQFDQFTGATITPRAVVGSVARTLRYLSANQQQLFNQSTDCQAGALSEGQN
ncbi:electron transport complex subunit RsxG [Alteromonas lipolytica]|uniref:Ion-translocating oxidoreductase complex subunit G n=1 Tax=Alteromonas lipolytica TaxID=1856405 RepID=A0A1E8FJ65_9ALTE|nr:electron transport complex subunit RsxG [Alteromonas lipolytica]OFI35964.1 electron transport complex subunit RsxG [Alteromonas lipolytica]GGF72082.1 electron transport complex subunit G [Alteromonas lipolytica]